jgi:hypothetical protein
MIMGLGKRDIPRYEEGKNHFLNETMLSCFYEYIQTTLSCDDI